MLTDDQLTEYYVGLKPSFDKALDDIRWDLDQFSKSNNTPDEVRLAFNTARVNGRVKSLQSFLRKCKRGALEEFTDIPSVVEDLIGLRVSAANKGAARKLFEHLRHFQGMNEGFCEIEGDPRFVPYTIEARNKYSLSSGYQGFHVTFICRKQYAAFPDGSRFPVEVQIMSRLWEFWAEYSREYFYGRESATISEYLLYNVYNVVISKILDNADDLMMATTERIREDVDPPEVVDPSDNQSAPTETDLHEDDPNAVNVHNLARWFSENSNKFFGQARTPNPFFLSEIAQTLEQWGINFLDLSSILSNPQVDRSFAAILSRSSLRFLPPYQTILAKIMLFKEADEQFLIDTVNRELRPLGMVLYQNPYPST